MSNVEPLNIELRQAFILLIAKHTGLEIKERDQEALSEKILARTAELKLASPNHYYRLLSSFGTITKQEWLNLATSLTNTDSYFFRDREQFSLLKNRILPELIERKKIIKTLRICSAGCSSGEEPYSLAILLKELIPDLERWNLTVLGVDINQSALQKAKVGEYSAWSFRRVLPEVKQQYFRLLNDKYYLDEQIKKMVTFQVLNLINDPFPASNTAFKEMDLILCRNVFIYFDFAAIANVLNKFCHALQPFGYLLTGHAEVVNQNLGLFHTKVFPESVIYQRRADNLLSLSSSMLSDQQEILLVNDDTIPDENLHIFQNAFEQNNMKMQRTALNLLRQLHPESRIPRLSNLTVAELIQQLEAEINLIEQERGHEIQ